MSAGAAVKCRARLRALQAQIPLRSMVGPSTAMQFQKRVSRVETCRRGERLLTARARARAQAEVAEAAAATAHKAAAAAAADVAGLAAQLARAPPAADTARPAPPSDGAAADSGASADALAQAHMRAALAEQRSAVAELKTRLDANAAYFQARAPHRCAPLCTRPGFSLALTGWHLCTLSFMHTACCPSSAAPRRSLSAPLARMPATRPVPGRRPAARRASDCLSRAGKRAGRAGRALAARAAGAQAPRLRGAGGVGRPGYPTVNLSGGRRPGVTPPYAWARRRCRTAWRRWASRWRPRWAHMPRRRRTAARSCSRLRSASTRCRRARRPRRGRGSTGRCLPQRSIRLYLGGAGGPARGLPWGCVRLPALRTRMVERLSRRRPALPVRGLVCRLSLCRWAAACCSGPIKRGPRRGAGGGGRAARGGRGASADPGGRAGRAALRRADARRACRRPRRNGGTPMFVSPPRPTRAYALTLPSMRAPDPLSGRYVGCRRPGQRRAGSFRAVPDARAKRCNRRARHARLLARAEIEAEYCSMRQS